MRKLSKKTAWIFEMDVEAPKNEAGEIERIIEDSNGVILGRKSSDDIIRFLMVLDLFAMDDLINKMLTIYPGRMKFNKAKAISFR